VTDDEQQKCEECGFVYETVSPADASAALRSYARRYRAPLTRFLPGEDGDALLRRRPDPTTWSALEYAGHVRDVFANYDRWIHQTLLEDRPVLNSYDPAGVVDADRYNDADPPTVADDLAAKAGQLADTIDSVPADAWERVGLRRGQERSLLFTARRAVHEGHHHLLDIGRVMRAGREQGAAPEGA